MPALTRLHAVFNSREVDVLDSTAIVYLLSAVVNGLGNQTVKPSTSNVSARHQMLEQDNQNTYSNNTHLYYTTYAAIFISCQQFAE